LTGGLADTIKDSVNGFTFYDFNADAFLDTFNRAIDVYRYHADVWKKMMVSAMQQDFSWKKSAEKYLALYSRLINSDFAECVNSAMGVD
jgi:starch synthase